MIETFRGIVGAGRKLSGVKCRILGEIPFTAIFNSFYLELLAEFFCFVCRNDWVSVLACLLGTKTFHQMILVVCRLTDESNMRAQSKNRAHCSKMLVIACRFDNVFICEMNNSAYIVLIRDDFCDLFPTPMTHILLQREENKIAKHSIWSSNFEPKFLYSWCFPLKNRFYYYEIQFCIVSDQTYMIICS